MPNRILRESILDSGPVNTLTWEAEVFYRRLMSVVDDYGRYDARPEVLRNRCYPIRSERVREPDIIRWLEECESAGLVTLYAICTGGQSRWLRTSELAEMFPLPGSGIGDGTNRAASLTGQAKAYLVFHKVSNPRAKASKYPDPPTEAKCPPVFDGSQTLCAPNDTSAHTCAQTRADVPYSNSYSYSNSGTAGAPTNGVNTASNPAELATLFLFHCKAPGFKPLLLDLTAAFTALVEAGWTIAELHAEIMRVDRLKSETFGVFQVRLQRAKEKAIKNGPAPETREQRMARQGRERQARKEERRRLEEEAASPEELKAILERRRKA